MLLLGIADVLSLIDQFSLSTDRQFLRHVFKIYRYECAFWHVKIGLGKMQRLAIYNFFVFHFVFVLLILAFRQQ